MTGPSNEPSASSVVPADSTSRSDNSDAKEQAVRESSDWSRAFGILDDLYAPGTGLLTRAKVAEACGTSPKTVDGWARRSKPKVPRESSAEPLLQLVLEHLGREAADDLRLRYSRLRTAAKARQIAGQRDAGRFNREIAGRPHRVPDWRYRLLLNIRLDGETVPTVNSRMTSAADGDSAQASEHWRFASHQTDNRMPSYVARTSDEKMDDLLTGDGPSVLIVSGEPRSGKTRSTIEALYRHPELCGRPLHEILRPSDGRDTLTSYAEALNHALSYDTEPRPVILIDDLHNHVRSPETELVRSSPVVTNLRNLGRNATVVATTHSWVLEADPDVIGLSPADQEWLRSHEVRVAAQIDADETYNVARVLGVAVDEGFMLGEFLGGTDLLDRLLKSALIDPNQLARACVIRALIDIGLFRNGSLAKPEEIIRLAKPYFNGPDAAGHLEQAIAWVARPVPASSSLSLVDWDDSSGSMVLDLRLFALNVESHESKRSDLTADELKLAGDAFFRVDHRKLANEWYERAAAHGHAGATLNLGAICHFATDETGAEAWYRKAYGLGSDLAAHNLGAMRLDQGLIDGPDGAEAWTLRAGSPLSPIAMTHMGHIRSIQGRHDGEDGAEAWYRKAASAGLPDAFGHLAQALRDRDEKAESMVWYQRAALLGDAVAMDQLAILHAEDGDVAEAELWHRAAASRGNERAMFNLGVLQHSNGQTKGEDGSQAWWLRAAEHGDGNAMVNVGLAALETTPPDRSTAETWFSRAAELGEPEGLRNLAALRHEDGRIDGEEGARQLYMRAAESGNADAMFNLGVLEEEAADTDAIESAKVWYQKAIESDPTDTDALFNLGSLLHRNSALEEASDVLVRSAALGDVRSANSLGVIREEQGRLSGADSAETWWKRAAESGYSGAMFNLGLLRSDQERLEGADSAVSWWRRAAVEGSSSAMCNLGHLRFRQGEVEGDDGAERWWRAAADLEHPTATLELGHLRESQGRCHGDDSASHWFERAAELGDIDASNETGRLRVEANRLSGPDGAESWFKRAALGGHAVAMYNIADLRLRTNDIAGPDGAESWWRQSADSDYAPAKYNLAVVARERGDVSAAEALYREGAEQGDIASMAGLGLLLEEKGEPEGEDWMKRAANAGDALSAYNLGIGRRDEGFLTGADSAEVWLRKGSALGSAEAMAALGALRFEAGELEGPDGAEAWLQRSCAAGFQLACEVLAASKRTDE